MPRKLAIFVFLFLQLCYHADSCPKGCQCFTSSKVFCSDEGLRKMPQNLSSEVKELVVMTTSITYIHPESFPLNSSLTKLMLLNNLLNGVSEMGFNSLVELKELEISGNRNFKEIGTDTFRQVGNLTRLLLNYNQLKTLDDSIFDSLQKLEILQLKGNVIDHLPRKLFRQLLQLRSLDLSENRISSVDKMLFNGLGMLETLRMNRNLISILHADMFMNTPHLKELGLQGNQIADLPQNLLSRLEYLNKLHLRGNLIAKISPGTFPSSLKELNLEDNKLAQLYTGVFKHMSYLTHLFLSKNQLACIPEDVFRNLTSLQHLSLSENHLTTLSPSTFSGLLGLTSVHLEKNNISSVAAHLFEDQGMMEQLYLSDNNLQTVPEGFFASLNFLHIARLHGNPWRCDCHILSFYYWLVDVDLLVSNMQMIYCAEPKSLKGQGLASLNREQLVCIENAATSLESAVVLSEPWNDKRPQTRSCTFQEVNGKISVRCTVQECPVVKTEINFSAEDGRTLHFVDEREWSDSTQCTKTMIILTF